MHRRHGERKVGNGETNKWHGKGREGNGVDARMRGNDVGGVMNREAGETGNYIRGVE